MSNFVNWLLSILSVAVLGIFFFYLAPPLSDAIEDALTLPIRNIFLFGFLILYYVHARLAWSRAAATWESDNRSVSSVRIVLRALYHPARDAVIFLYKQVYAILEYFIFRHLHKDVRAIVDRAYAVAMLIWV